MWRDLLCALILDNCNSWEHAGSTPGPGVNPPGTTSSRNYLGENLYQGRSIPAERSEVDPKEGSGSEFNPDGAEGNPSMFGLLSNLIP